MKFILNKDTLEIEDIEVVKSGSVSYYEANVEYDESWKDLVIEAVMVKKNEDTGTSIAVINNKMYIDQNLRGTYCIGFVGYKLEGENKEYQVSTNLKSIYFDKGAGEIETENPELPTLTEWEIYIAQIKEMLKDISVGGGAIDDVLVDGVSVVSNKIANIQLRQTIIDVLVEYGLIQLESLTEEQIQALNEMECTIDENGELSIAYDETILNLGFEIQDGNLIIDNNINATFSINEVGELEVNYE